MIPRAAGGFTAVFGYTNSGSENVRIPVGDLNQVSGGAVVHGQPQWFKASSSPGASEDFAFTADAATTSDEVIWKVGGQTARANASTARCRHNPNGADGEEITVGDKTITIAYSPTKVATQAVKPTAATIGATGTMGTLLGTLDVTSNGNASYTIPLDMPVGRRGIEPQLALAYNSDTETNGYLDVGWSLTGWCPQFVRSSPIWEKKCKTPL